MRQASRPLYAALCLDKCLTSLSVQEVELAADVQRNLTAAISDLEELEQHRNPVLEPIAKKGTYVIFNWLKAGCAVSTADPRSRL